MQPVAGFVQQRCELSCRRSKPKAPAAAESECCAYENASMDWDAVDAAELHPLLHARESEA